MMDTLLRDVRYALRQLARNPAFAGVAALTLALGIGANVTVFSWARAVMLEPVPGAADPGRLVKFLTADPDEEYISLSFPDYRDYRDRNTTLAGFVAVRNVAASLGADATSERIWAQLVTGNFFETLGVRAEQGRLLQPSDDQAPNAHAVVVLSDGFWRRRFGGDPAVVGRSVLLNTRPYTVIGVADPEFRGLEPGLAFDAWVPMMMQEQFEPGGSRIEQRGNRWLNGYARLKPDLALEQAQAELNTIARQIEQEHEGKPSGRSAALFPLWRAPRTSAAILGPFIFVLAGVVGLILLMACANLASVLLARGISRRREIAIRLSLGARRSDLVRQLLSESLLLALLGGAGGLLVASAGLDLLAAWIPPTNFPITLGASLDGRALGFALGVSLLTGIVFGLAPALASARRDTVEALRDESGSVASGHAPTRLRNGLIVAQLALSVVLLVAAGLFVRSLRSIHAYDLGFNPRGVLTASLELFTSGYDEARGRAFFRELRERLRALPGVTDVSFARRLPLGIGGTSSSSITVPGHEPPADRYAWGYYNQVGPGYFATLQMTVVRGRDFSDADDENALRVTVINESMAERYWPGRDPVGARFQLGDTWLTVAGVVRNATLRDLNEGPSPWFFLPVLQAYRPDTTLLVRSAADPASLARPLAETVASLDPNLALFGVRTLQAHIGGSDFRQRAGSQILGLFGVIGLALAAIGLYGVLAFAVAQRTREIGIRMALGGAQRDIFRLVLVRGVGLTLAGLGLGVALAAALSRLLASLLIGVGPWDPLTFAGVAALLGAVALLACALPARRAARVDPLVALRTE